MWRHMMVKSDMCIMVRSALTQHNLYLQENEADMLNLSPAAVLYSEVKHHKLQLLLNSHHITRETDDFKHLKMFYCEGQRYRNYFHCACLLYVHNVLIEKSHTRLCIFQCHREGKRKISVSATGTPSDTNTKLGCNAASQPVYSRMNIC